MIHEAGYDIIDFLPASKGMNQNISADVLPMEYSCYIENIMPLSLGESQVRFGTSSFFKNAPDKFMKAFPFTADNGSEQQVFYFIGYQNYTYSNFRIVSSTNIVLTSPDFARFKKDTLLKINFETPQGISPDLYYLIKNITNVIGQPNTINIQLQENAFPDQIDDFYISFVTSVPLNPIKTSATVFTVDVPNDFISSLYFYDGQTLKLIGIDTIEVDIAVGGIDSSVVGKVTFTVTNPNIPDDINTRTLSFKSLTPKLSVLLNSYGYIKILDIPTNTILAGGDQTLSNLSVACVPRAEYFARKLWIYNGVDNIMTWDGTTLEIYEEEIKEIAQNFNRIDNLNFSFVYDPIFDTSKYSAGKKITLIISGVDDPFTTTVVNAVKGDTIVTITTTDNIPNFTGQNRVSLFYYDRPPKFSFMKGALDRLWCLGEGAVSLEYRIPDLSLRFYYSYKEFSDDVEFKFFNEKTKFVPSEDISAKHGIADNLEAIANVSGNMIFIGRERSQIWRGNDPVTEQGFVWNTTLPVGIYHGNLIVELPNDAQFLSPNGFVSFGTLNIAKQFAASDTPNMDKLALQYIRTIENNYQYRLCDSFKYNSGSFCGFRIGPNDLIVSKFHTSFFWWGIFSGDFSRSACFLTSSTDNLYLYINKDIYRYADGINGVRTLYGDQDETKSINFSETKCLYKKKSRFANKRYEIDCDYSSSIVINPTNNIYMYISGNLRNTFVLEDLYKLPQKGDVLGTIPLVDGRNAGPNPNFPNPDVLGMRLDSPSHIKKGRLKFVSNKFFVSIAGKIKNGPFVLKNGRLFGILER